MACLSQGGIWASCIVVVLLVICSSGEILFLKREKGIEELHWTCSSWILLTAGLAFIYAGGALTRIFLLCCMIISHYMSLYRTCYYEKISFAYLRRAFGDLPVLFFYYLPAFWQWREPFESRRKRRSWTVGLICLAIFLSCVILPLYVSVDARMGNIVVLCLWKVIVMLPFWLICMVLGIIPAMLNYSLIRGLLEDIVTKNPEWNQNVQEPDNTTVGGGYLALESIFGVMLWGMAAVNVVLACLQVNFLFQLQLSAQNFESAHVMRGTLPLLTAVAIGVVFVATSGYMAGRQERMKFRMASLIYLLTLMAVLLLLVWRYMIKIINYGINDLNLFGLLAVMVLVVALCICIQATFYKNVQIWKKIVLWGTVLFVLISVVPIEYFAAEINVQVFINKLDKGEIEESELKEELDLDYLGDLGYDAVPALGRLVQISTSNEDAGEYIGQIVKNKLLDIYYLDLSEEERDQIAEKDIEDGVRQLVSILKEKAKYQVIGKRKISLQALAKSVGMLIK